MAVTATHLVTGGNNADQTNYSTGSITPTANRLVLASVFSEVATGNPDIPTVTGNGLTWVQDASSLDGVGSQTRRLTLFRAMGASPTAGAVTIDFGATTQLGCQWSISEYAGIDTTGTNGSGAIVQSAADHATADPTMSVTLGAFGSSDNATYGAFAQNKNTTFTAGSGFSLLGQAAHGNPGQTTASEWKATNDTSVDFTSLVSGRIIGIAAEIKALVAGGGATVTPAVIATTVDLPQATPFAGSPPPPAGLEYVASATGTSSLTDVTATFATAPPLNALLVAVASTNTGVGTSWNTPAGWTPVTSVTSVSSDPVATRMWWRFADGSTTNYVFTNGFSTSRKTLAIHQFSGNFDAAPLDVSVTNTGQTGTVTSQSTGTTATTTRSDEVAVAVVAAATVSASAGIGWVNAWNPTSYTSVTKIQAGTNNSASTAVYQNTAYRVLTATGTAQGTASWTTPYHAVGLIATFKAAVAGPRSGTTSLSGRGIISSTGRSGAVTGGTADTLTAGGSITAVGSPVAAHRLQTSSIAVITTGSSIQAFWRSATTTSNLLLAIIAGRSAGTPDLGFAPPAGWTALPASVNPDDVVTQMFYVANAAARSGAEIFTLSRAAEATLQLAEVEGIAAAPLDQQAAFSGTGVTASTGATPLTTQNDEYWVAVVAARQTTTFSNATSGFEIIGQAASSPTDASTRVSMVTLDNAVSQAGVAETGATLSTSRAWAAKLVTFKTASSVPTVLFAAGSLSTSAEIQGTGSAEARAVAGMELSARIEGRATISTPAAVTIGGLRRDQHELAVLISEPHVSYDFDAFRNTIYVLGAKPERGRTRISAKAVADRNHPLSPWSMARNGEPRHVVEVIETGARVREKGKANKLAESLINRTAHAQDIADRVLKDRLRAHYKAEFEVLAQPHLEIGDLLVVKARGVGRLEFRVRSYSLALTSAGGMSINTNKRPGLLKQRGKRRRK